MRPIPQSRHIIAVIIFIAIAMASAYLSKLDSRLSDEQTQLATAAMKRHATNLMEYDQVFGNSGLWRLHMPAFSGLMEMVLVPTNYSQMALPFKLMCGIAVLVYLCGMYALLFNQSQSWSASAFVSILSMAIIDTFGRYFWGIGSLASITPMGLVQAVTPLIVLSFIRYIDRWQILLVFAFIGACGNLHMASAVNLAIILITVYLTWRRFSIHTLAMGVACAASVAMTALPYTLYFLTLRENISGGDLTMSISVAHRALQSASHSVLYPEMLKHLPNWLTMTGLLLLPSIGSLLGVERFRLKDVRMWFWFFAAAVVTAFGLHGISQMIGTYKDQAPPVIGFIQASSIAILPLYVLLAQAITHLFRLLKSHYALGLWACTIVMIAWLLPSDNLRVARHAIGEMATSFLAEGDQPQRMKAIRMKQKSDDELSRIADWARESTHQNSVFVIDSDEFRMLSQRSILACAPDVDYFYFLAPGQLTEWSKTLRTQSALLASGKTDELAAFCTSQRSKPLYDGCGDWYAIIRSATASGDLAPLIEITPPNEQWGTYWKVFKIPRPAVNSPATMPTANELK